MSAICGILQHGDARASERDVDRMLATMVHRAPDRRRVWSGGPMALGHGLMRVTQEDAVDNQPLVRRDGAVTLVADLRLDNRSELAGMLGINDAALCDMPDSALLLRAYEQWGRDCAKHLLGDFAFALWDGRARELVLARDHMGQRHVFYHAGKDFFAFSTEIKGLWALGDVPRTHSGHPQQPLSTPLGNRMGREDGPTNAVPGGTMMTVSTDSGIAMRRYWEPHGDARHVGQNEAYYVSAYREVLGEAVACRLRRTTRPAGLLFSGGFDSGAIAALAGPTVTAQGRKLVVASSVMPQDYRGTIRHARRWTELFRKQMPYLDMHYITREGLDIFTGLERSFLLTDGVQGTGHYVNNALYEAIASAGARVVMDGHGGDYTLNVRGFPWLLDLLRQGKFRNFVSEFRAFQRFSGASVWQTVKGEVLSPLLPQYQAIKTRYRNGLALFGPTTPFTKEFQASMARDMSVLPRPSGSSEQKRARMRDILAAQLNARANTGDVPAAMHGLEFTRPFHDKRVVELALAIPEEFWVKNGRERYLARLALNDLYPPEFQHRGRGNDDAVPDFLAMVKSAEPKILAEIRRMEEEGKLSAYFDFPKMRRMLMRRRAEDHNSGSEYDTRQAVLALLRARYMEWSKRQN